MRIDRVLPRFLLAVLLGCVAIGVPAQGLLDELAVAAANDRPDDVRKLIGRGMDPNSVDANGDTPLCIAARNGSARTIDVLLSAKADPNRPNRFNDTPLMLASLSGNLEVVRRLVAAGAAIDPPGWTPLIYAATGGHDAIVTFLAQRGANLDAASPNGTTALMMAIREH